MTGLFSSSDDRRAFQRRIAEQRDAERGTSSSNGRVFSGRATITGNVMGVAAEVAWALLLGLDPREHVRSHDRGDAGWDLRVGTRTIDCKGIPPSGRLFAEKEGRQPVTAEIIAWAEFFREEELARPVGWQEMATVRFSCPTITMYGNVLYVVDRRLVWRPELLRNFVKS